ncbi:cyclic pyranopterin monophosphate synthase MoaC [Bdellovibrionota bacterium FG-2]
MSTFKMINVGEKTSTHRRAVAFGKIEMAIQTAQRIAARDMPKGDVLALAEMTGIMGAKRVSETLPLCHPLPLDAVYVKCEVQGSEVVVSCEAHAFAKTGVEMEALAGVSAALLCVYDLTKGIDPVLTISGIHLSVKEGGKSGVWVNPNHAPAAAEPQAALALNGVRARVLIVSDRCSRGDAQDTSGPKAVEILKAQGASDICLRVVADEVALVAAAIERFSKTDKADLIVVAGGTGISPRDITPEALTLTNSVLGTKQAVDRYFGESVHRVSIKSLLVSIGLGNLLTAAVAGLPFCHGSGGARSALSNIVMAVALLGFWFGPSGLGIAPFLLSSLLMATGVFHMGLAVETWRLPVGKLKLLVAAGVTVLTNNMLWVLCVAIAFEVLEEGLCYLTLKRAES